MKTIFSFFVAAVFLVSCNNKENKKTNVAEKDTSATVPSEAGTQYPADTLTQTHKADSAENPKENVGGPALEGRHNFTLQWIGWNVPGLAVIKKDKDDWYSIKGRQESKDGNTGACKI